MDLEERVKRLERVIDHLADQISLAYRYREEDPQSSLNKSRIVLEKILLDLYPKITGRDPKKPEIGGMLNDNQFTRKLERRIVSRMNAIRDMGNLGTHGEDVVGKDAILVLDNLCDVVEWYLDQSAVLKSQKSSETIEQQQEQPNSQCHSCGGKVKSDWDLCPFCGNPLKLKCPTCQGSVEVDWQLCPACGHILQENPPQISRKREIPLKKSSKHLESNGSPALVQRDAQKGHDDNLAQSPRSIQFQPESIEAHPEIQVPKPLSMEDVADDDEGSLRRERLQPLLYQGIVRYLVQRKRLYESRHKKSPLKKQPSKTGTPINVKGKPKQSLMTEKAHHDWMNIEMVHIPEGEFLMGSKRIKEKPIHRVTISSFEMGKYPVTQGLWKAVMGNNPSAFQAYEVAPVEMVSWDDCQKFIVRLNEMTGENYRLPTEAEWEYACRGDIKKDHDEKIDDIAWHRENSDGTTHPVGRRQPNTFGLYDMQGNVWEWVADRYGAYKNKETRNPKGPRIGRQHIIRGGSCFSHSSTCTVSERRPLYKHMKIGGISRPLGFRLAKS